MTSAEKLLRRMRRRLWNVLQPADPLPTFATSPRNLRIPAPRTIRGPERMHIGDDVDLGPNCILKVTTEYPRGWAETDEYDVPVQRFDPKIVIGSHVTATSGLHVAAFDEITIEDDVLMASNIFLSDAMHAFETANVPYRYQGFFRVAPIRIGRGAWLGQNVVVMPGVTIGELAIVGANSVVTKSVPPKSIAAGSPARVIRTWNDATDRWEDAPTAAANDEHP